MKQSTPGLMDIDDLFHSQQDQIAKFAEIQVRLYREEVSLQDYFLALDLEVFDGPRTVHSGRTAVNPLLAWTFHAADKTIRVFKSRKLKADVLFCPTPYFDRPSEIRFLSRTLLGLSQTGAEILCLLPVYVPVRQELEAALEAAGCSKQVTFLDPGMPFYPFEGRMRSIAARLRGRAAFEKTVQILQPHGLSPNTDALTKFERSAQYVEAWERVASSIEFDAVVARCHWYDLCSSVCRTALQRGKPVITFQQGVITQTTDVPVTASKFVAFGAPSASVLAETNRRFFDAVGKPEPRIDYFPAGSLFDTLLPLPDQFSLQTVLIIDLHSVPTDPFGTKEQTQALLQMAKDLLAAKLSLRHLVIRPHPHWSNFDLEACLKLAREHRDVCELSHPIWSLEDDLRRSSVVVGIASGVLTVASACGLPAIFLQTEHGFRTRDLACFSPAQTLSPEAAFREVSRLLTKPESYAEARKVALRNGSEYYARGANAVLDGAFFTRLLSDTPMRNAARDHPQ